MRQAATILGTIVTCGLSCSAIAASPATVKQAIRYDELISAGGVVPDGSGFHVVHVEAPDANSNYLPDEIPPINALFAGKTLTPRNGPSGVSTHAKSIGQRFYGQGSSVTPAVDTIDLYQASPWLTDSFLRVMSGAAPQTSNARLANHSWGESAAPHSFALEALERLDYLVEKREFVQVVGIENEESNPTDPSAAVNQSPLLSSAYNAIVVGRTDARHKIGSADVSSPLLYRSGRVKPDLVVPEEKTSYAAPWVASTAVLLMNTAQDAGYLNGDRSEVIKAALMAGARRTDINPTTNPYGLTYTVNTANGLSDRFGAGELDVLNSYQIVAGGEHDSQEDGGSGPLGQHGFDYDPSFGGQRHSNIEATYHITGYKSLIASLVWNIRIDLDEITDGDDNLLEAASLFNLDLQLLDITGGNTAELASSLSLDENTENITAQLDPTHEYRLKVLRGPGQGDFEHDYALAWRLTPVPDPATLSLLGLGAAGATLRSPRRRASHR